MTKKKRGKHGGKRVAGPGKRIGRPRKAKRVINPVVQVGRHPQEEIDQIDAAAEAKGMTRIEWCWGVLMRAAKRQLRA